MIFIKNKFFITLVFCTFAFSCKSETIIKENVFWRYSHSFHTNLDSMNNETSKNYFDYFLNDKYITIDKKNISINNDCEFIYSKVKKKPISYWMSNKTLSFYMNFFNDKKIKIGDEIGVFYPDNPNDICGEKYGDLLLIDNKLINIAYEKIDVYSHVNEKPVLDFWCTSEDNIEEFEFKSYCYFPDKNIFEAYTYNYNIAIKNGEIYLLDKISNGKDLNKTYGDGHMDRSVFVSYKWDGVKKLTIEQKFPGGDKEIILEENKNDFNGTVITTIDRPD
ncbi:hypothetical protein [Providencia rettgeri]|uniref:hypothetical protein n=1 Tax=Providencia rettgeri TaxID=587 RepID=UPI0034E0B7D2